MIITCPSCATRYSLDETNIPEDGRQVRCAQCAHVWHQDQPEPNDLVSLDQGTQDAASDSVPQLEEQPQPEAEDSPEPEAEDDDSFEIDVEDASEADESAPADDMEQPEPEELEPEELEPEELEPEELEPEDPEPEEPEPEEPADIDETEELENVDAGRDDEEETQDVRIAEWRSARARARAGAADVKRSAPQSNTRGWIILAVVLATAIGAIAGFRGEIESAWPPSQRLYDLFDGWFAADDHETQEAEEADLEDEPEDVPKSIIIDVTSSRVAVIDGQRVLLIEGMIANPSTSALSVPDMHGALLDGEGNALHEWDFSVPFTTIEAGSKREFETRVVEPPSGARVMKLDPLINN